eukprot:13887104-Alexandrium_andersonii.AAC.1
MRSPAQWGRPAHRSRVGTPSRSLQWLSQSELGAQHPARGGGSPSAPNGTDGPLRGSESAKVGEPHSA